MGRELLVLESWRFTSTSALAREIIALLENSSYKLEIMAKPDEMERLNNELDGAKTMGRVKVKTNG